MTSETKKPTGTPLPWMTDDSKLVRSEATGQMVLDLNDDATRAKWLDTEPQK
jgi:hypothetical protein